MAVVDNDNSNISPGGIRRKQAAQLGYLLGVPLTPLATPPIVPAEKPLRIGQPIEPKIPIGVPPASMKPVPTPRTTGTLGATLAAPESPLATRASESLKALTPGGSELMPTIGRPTRAESEAAGRTEYAEGLPEVTAPIGSSDWYTQRAAREEYRKEHPWGSPISSHPGTLGKIGHTLATIANDAGDILAPSRMAEIPGTQLHRDIELRNDLAGAHKARESEQRYGLNAARLGELQAQTGAAKTRQALDQQRLDNLKRGPADKMLTHGVDQNGEAVVTFQRPDGSVYTVPAGYQPQGKTQTPKMLRSPFEAFAYGSPAEKKAAANFLALERRTGARYREPSELQERYLLYKQDPKAYKAMFGTKNGGGISQATATKMLNYFDRRRKEITDPLHVPPLTDAEIKQKLAEIDQLEKPFMDAARGIQAGSASGNGGGQLPPGWTR